jgi:NAD-dependent deacetylase
MVPAAKEAGAFVVIVNAEPTPLDGVADVVLRESISQVLPAICGYMMEPCQPGDRQT